MKYFKITNVNNVADHFNESTQNINGTPYRVIEGAEEYKIISNVPSQIYDNPQIKKYTTPKSKKLENCEQVISFLHEGVNFFHNNFPDAYQKYEDGKIFHYNNCYDNSIGAYYCLQNLAENNNLPITTPISICLGYISNSVKPGTSAGNAVINIPNLVIHDWHIWNKLNDFIIDLSITNHGGIHSLQTKTLKWERAEDHIFKNPPRNLTYYGVDFADQLKFHKYTEEIFGTF